MNHHTFSRAAALSASILVLGFAGMANAQVVDADPAPQQGSDGTDRDEIIVTGIRQALSSALVQERTADSLIEVIQAEDIGKLPDQNLAEVLENITGVQITREEGVGTGVQIRGSDQNLIQFNGVETVGSGNGRSGVNFTDVNPAIISGLEVIKAPTAYHIEGAVGGTINLRTIRPLEIDGTLASVRVQGEDSSLTEGISPRVSAALGKKWDNLSGQEFAVVLSGSYTESENTAFRPRLDRDNLVVCTGDPRPLYCPAGVDAFLGVQFLNQVQRTQEFETLNFAGSLEAKPTDTVRLFADFIYNDQERLLSGSRVQASNVSRLNGSGDRAVVPGGNANFTAFDTVNIGSVIGETGIQDFGTIGIVTQGTFTPLQEDAQVNDGRGAPFLRVGSDAGSRLTETTTLRLGGEWEATEALTLVAEFAESRSDTVNPNLSINLNFINPNSFIAPSGDNFRDENGTPIIFDLTDGFGFDVNFNDPFAPTEAQLLDPNNYVVDGNPTYSSDIRDNVSTALRLDASYDFGATGLSQYLTSFDAGIRFAERSSLRDDRDAQRRGSSRLNGSLNAGGIAQFVSVIPDNFADGTGNALAVDGVLQVDPNLTRDAASAVTAINAAAVAQGLDPIFGTELISSDSAFFDIEEDTLAIYGQANFDFGRLRGNAGLRYVDTDIASTANQFTDGVATLVTVESGYDHYLPRVNLAFDVSDDVVLRGSYNEDIRRPSFTSITAARTFPDAGGVNSNSVGGNPFLVPEEVQSLDASIDWYFAPEAVLSVGVFRKERDGLFGAIVDAPDETGGTRDVTPPCEGGGIFSPGTSPGIFGDEAATGLGVCVGNQSTFNSENSTTQEGIELALQYNFADWEDRFGRFAWASGFGFIANYTYQNEDNNTGFVDVSGNRNRTIFANQGFANPTREAATLLNLSNNAYNLTGFYEKHGISARLRYTWRDAFATDDLPGTGNVFTPFGYRGIQESRGQLNGSLSYDVTEQLTLQVDGVNLTESSSDVYCLSDGGLLCYQGITDRRIVFGASYTF